MATTLLGLFGLGHWELIALLIVLLIVLVPGLVLLLCSVVKRMGRRRGSTAEWICKACGNVGSPRGYMPGSGAVEVLLFLFGIWPGLLYAGWRSGKSYEGCAVCKSREIVPVDSPVGYQLLKKQRGV